MTPSADHADAPDARIAVSSTVLDDGEIVILALKPSGWFVLQVSWPVLAIFVLGSAVLGILRATGPHQAVLLACAAAVLLRIIVACFQWMGLLYVLTNKRVIKLRGLNRMDVASCALRDISEVEVASSALENPVGVGSLYFHTSSGLSPDTAWVSVARPQEVRETIEKAIRDPW